MGRGMLPWTRLGSIQDTGFGRGGGRSSVPRGLRAEWSRGRVSDTDTTRSHSVGFWPEPPDNVLVNGSARVRR